MKNVTIQHFFQKKLKKCLTGFLRDFVFLRAIDKSMRNLPANRRTLPLWRCQCTMPWSARSVSWKTPSARA